jgi:hypothetical protein
MPRLIDPYQQFVAQALHDPSDPRLAPGVHLRLFADPWLGLPVQPFEVYRTQVDLRERKTRRLRTGRMGNARVTLPVYVRPEEPLVMDLTREGRVVWVHVHTSAGPSDHRYFSPGSFEIEAHVHSPRGPRRAAHRTEPPFVLSGTRLDQLVIRGQGYVNAIDIYTSDQFTVDEDALWRYLDLPVTKTPLYRGFPNAEARAFGRVERGAARRMSPHQDPSVSNPSTAPTWSPAEELDRVRDRQASIGDPLKTLTHLAQREEQRTVTDVQTVTASNGTIGSAEIPVLPSLLQMLFDPGIARYLGFADVDASPLSTETGVLLQYWIRGVFAIPTEWARLYPEFAVTDEPPAVTPSTPRTQLYETLERNPLSDVDFRRLRTTNTVLGGTSVLRSTRLGDRLRSRLGGFRGRPQIEPQLLPEEGTFDLDRFSGYSFATLWTVATVPYGLPPAPPPAPEYEGRSYGGWMPAQPPTAERKITISLSGLEVGGVLAMARHERRGVLRINDRQPAESVRAPLLVPSLQANRSRDAADFDDRTAPPEAFRYRIAQSDVFGRWSSWMNLYVPEGDRPRPPGADLTLFYSPPEVTPDTAGPQSGTLILDVPVPPEESLPPGGRLLDHLEVQAGSVQGVFADVEVALDGPGVSPSSSGVQVTERADASTGTTRLSIAIPGPAIDRAGSEDIEVRVRWVDNGFARSSEWAVTTRTLLDPRPPEQLPPFDTLQYASRADAQGRSRVTLTWTPASRQRRFRIYYADETRLRAADSSLDSALGEERDPAARATTIKNHATDLARGAFELITPDPIEIAGGQATTPHTFEHEVSGSLRVLSVYRVVPVSEANVEASFADAPIACFGVPPSDAPPRPFLAAHLKRDADGIALSPPEVDLVVEVPRGSVPPATARLRRSHTTTDPSRMPVVVTQPLPPDPSGDGAPAEEGDRRSYTITDDGPIQDLAPQLSLAWWMTYHYRVEVQGGPLPGSTRPGAWSRTSAPATLSTIPPEPPAPIESFNVTTSPRRARLAWTHPDRLDGGPMGRYRFDVYGRRPGETDRYLGSLYADTSPSRGGRRDLTDAFTFEHVDDHDPSMAYRVILVDPIGRSSAPSASVAA